MNDTIKSLEEYSSLKDCDEYWVERAKNRFAVTIEKLMEHRGLKKKDLAANMGKSAPYMTKMLSGDANLTIDTMVRVARSLDSELHIHLSPSESKSQPWIKLLCKEGNGAQRKESDLFGAHLWAERKRTANG